MRNVRTRSPTPHTKPGIFIRLVLGVFKLLNVFYIIRKICGECLFGIIVFSAFTLPCFLSLFLFFHFYEPLSWPLTLSHLSSSLILVLGNCRHFDLIKTLIFTFTLHPSQYCMCFHIYSSQRFTTVNSNLYKIHFWHLWESLTNLL